MEPKVDFGPWDLIHKRLRCGMCTKDKCTPVRQMKMKMQEGYDCDGFKYRLPRRGKEK